VLEVNAVPGWKALARTLRLDVAGMVLALLEQQAAGDGVMVKWEENCP